MKKLYTLLSVIIASVGFAQGPFTATYDFASVTNASGATDPTPVPVAAGVYFSSFVATNLVAPPTNSTASGRFSFINQPEGGINGDDNYSNFSGFVDTGVFFEVTVGPNSGGQIDLSSITFVGRRSGTGVRNFAVRSSLDGFTTNLPASVGASTLVSVQPNDIFFVILDATTSNLPGMTITLGTAFENLTSNVTFRFYGFNAEGSGGTFSIDNVAFSGNVDVLSSSSFNNIEGLKMYPNPLKGNTLLLTSTANNEMSVQIFDVLGKNVLNSEVTNNTVNVSSLTTGVYIVKITEDGKTATRKLVIE
ncbi:T9SS type A sorting domain-containing protein [Flavobacterium sp. LMO8]|uniref:T9SS type A sorting domain-containing protein n=1 Tax=Flavobacterium sp. LMO8 TaxID=2654244 RepID=UPI0012910A96|nr:T9SS type A sorting domain-containing protein [Flavobacterium sp. LMO8]MQP25224.1 T9SS type A sorting domain-containing protein [Flavobacterium sp. LMO8]